MPEMGDWKANHSLARPYFWKPNVFAKKGDVRCFHHPSFGNAFAPSLDSFYNENQARRTDGIRNREHVYKFNCW